MSEQPKGTLRITAEDLERFETYAQAASSGIWEVGRSGTETIDAAVEYMATALRKRTTAELWMIVTGDPLVMPAFTGNGPTSEANANYLAVAQPHNLRVLVAFVRAMMDDRPYLAVPGQHVTIELESEAPHALEGHTPN